MSRLSEEMSSLSSNETDTTYYATNDLQRKLCGIDSDEETREGSVDREHDSPMADPAWNRVLRIPQWSEAEVSELEAQLNELVSDQTEKMGSLTMKHAAAQDSRQPRAAEVARLHVQETEARLPPPEPLQPQVPIAFPPLLQAATATVHPESNLRAPTLAPGSSRRECFESILNANPQHVYGASERVQCFESVLSTNPQYVHAFNQEQQSRGSVFPSLAENNDIAALARNSIPRDPQETTMYPNQAGQKLPPPPPELYSTEEERSLKKRKRNYADRPLAKSETSKRRENDKARKVNLEEEEETPHLSKKDLLLLEKAIRNLGGKQSITKNPRKQPEAHSDLQQDEEKTSQAHAKQHGRETGMKLAAKVRLLLQREKNEMARRKREQDLLMEEKSAGDLRLIQSKKTQQDEHNTR